MPLDRYDQKILTLLVKDARLSVSDISRQVNLSRSAVSERIKRMEEEGQITGYHAHINVAKHEGVAAYIELAFQPLSCELVTPLVEAIPEVKLAHSVSGDVDMIMFVQASSMDRLCAIREEIEKWPNLHRVMTHMCLATRVDRW